MDIESLKTFLVLSDTKNYTRTATQLFIAQSTVTNRINELEKELGFLLFTRSNRIVELTTEGEQFKEYAKNVISLTNDSLAKINSIHKFNNHLRIGCSDSIYESHLASSILDHCTSNPNDSIKISIGLSSQLLEALQNDIFDVIFTYLPMHKHNFHCEVYKQDSMVLVTDVANQKYTEGITQNDLISENYLMCNFALQNVGQFIRGLFPRYHQFALEIDDCAKIIPFLINQNNYTFLPGNIAQPYIESNKLRIIPLIDFETPVINSYIICKKNKLDLCKAIFL